MVSYFTYPSKVGEMKTKTNANAVRMLNASALLLDFLIAMRIGPLMKREKKKIAYLVIVCLLIE